MKIALETIAYQLKDSFPVSLNSLVSDIYTFIDKHDKATTSSVLKSHPAVKDIEKLIFQRFGMKVIFGKHLHVFSPGAIIPFFGDYYRDLNKVNDFSSNKVFGFIPAAYKEINTILKEREKVRKHLHNRSGYIDTKLAKMGGYLSEVTHYLIIDFVGFKNFGLSSSELTAVILHELGHAFDGMEEHHRLEKTNRAIFDVLYELNEKRYEKAVYIFQNEIGSDEFKDKSLEDTNVRYDFCAKLALAYLGEIKSQMPDSKYDETNFENMADTFATRFGMGKELVSGLHKLHTSSLTVIRKSALAIGLFHTLDVLTLAATLLVFPLWGVAVFWGIVIALSGSDKADMTYDDAIDRYARVLNTIVGAMKKMDAPEEVIRELLEQYEYINNLIKNFTSPKTLVHELADVIVPKARSARYYSDLQKSLEKNLNNDLFVKSSQLRVL